jgi:predicted nicotinamide N-methyase
VPAPLRPGGGLAAAPAETGGRADRHDEFIQANTVLLAPAMVPEIVLYLASSVIPFWQATENWLAEANVDAPFWAFAWPGGQALARHILDHPTLVRGRRVLDFAAGCGIAGIAAALAGAAAVEAADISAMARAATRLNALANGVAVTTLPHDIVGQGCRWDLILAGDVCYEAPMTRHILPWLRGMAADCEIWVADPGRAYLPKDGLDRLASYTVPTNLELEDRNERETTLYRLRPGTAEPVLPPA